MISVSVHRFESENCESKVQSIKFHSPLGFASWLECAKRFYSKDVEHGGIHMVHIILGIGEEHWEIHIEKIRGEIRIQEWDVTPDQGFFETVQY